MSNNSQEILNGLLSKSGDVSMFFDVDGTLKHSKSEHQPQGFHLNLPLVLFNLYQLGQVGIATDQSQLELQGFVDKLSKHLGQSVTTCSFGY